VTDIAGIGAGGSSCDQAMASQPAFTASAGTDIAVLIAYYPRIRQLYIDDE
jgi:hypothetical protein